jgi:chemotaxis protein MotB
VFYSNWELSAARAGSVVRVLSGHGVAPNRLAVIGYGEQRPMQTNDSAEGRNANRRVVVVILSTELMRQTDPAQLSAPAAGAAVTDAAAPKNANGVTLPSGTNGVNDADAAEGGAIASPADSPQAIPAPAAPITPTPAASAQAPAPPNTGTEPAP